MISEASNKYRIGNLSKSSLNLVEIAEFDFLQLESHFKDTGEYFTSFIDRKGGVKSGELFAVDAVSLHLVVIFNLNAESPVAIIKSTIYN
mmetsp:Transcript_32055/g.28415  ORF Transcript_32055/g.28415 Transcript_32055/m.28415 type:complete len:90 (-) Transcript_32055:11-280(-)